MVPTCFHLARVGTVYIWSNTSYIKQKGMHNLLLDPKPHPCKGVTLEAFLFPSQTWPDLAW